MHLKQLRLDRGGTNHASWKLRCKHRSTHQCICNLLHGILLMVYQMDTIPIEEKKKKRKNEKKEEKKNKISVKTFQFSQ